MVDNMFYKDANGKLTFKKLEFEIMITDIIDKVEPKNIEDLEWMVKKMVEAVQLCAWEYTNYCDDIEEDWEDIFCEY